MSGPHRNPKFFCYIEIQKRSRHMKKKEIKMESADIWVDGELVETIKIEFPSQLWRAMDKLPDNSTVVCKWTNGRRKTFKVSRRKS